MPYPEDHELQTIMAEMDMGEEARRFLSSSIGRYVLGRAQQDAEAAMAELKTVDPADAAKIAALQGKIARAEMLGQYLAELIAGADQAQQIWEEILSGD